MSVRSANAAKTSAILLREEREEHVRRQSVAGLIDLRRLLAEYSLVAEGEEGGTYAKGIQTQVSQVLKRHSLSEQAPKSRRFSEATSNELALADEAFDEVQRLIAETVDEGEALTGNR